MSPAVEVVLQVLVVVGVAGVVAWVVYWTLGSIKDAGAAEAGAQSFWHPATFRGRRCRAVKEPNPSGSWGRCERPAGHDGDHALERGMDVPRWSTEWTPGGAR